MRERLAITGMGAVTPVGLDVEAYWDNLVAGKGGIGSISRFDASRLPVRIAAEIRDFDPMRLPHQLQKSASLFMQYAYAAGEEALVQANLAGNADPARVGVCMGSALAGVDDAGRAAVIYEESASGKISPHLVPRIIGNMAAAHIAITHGFHGPGLTLGTACSAGGDAALSAAMLLLADEADAMLIMGGESILSPSIVSSLAQARALSRANDEPEKASRPFDLHRDGFVIGEGGGAIVLERESHARARGAKIFAILAGWGNTLDGFHVTAPDPSGEGAARCMAHALTKADLSPADIGYINAHGTSTQLGDKAETLALKKVFGTPPPVSSTKGATGHLMGAGGLTELIAAVKTLETGLLPPTLNLHNPDPNCDLDYIPLRARESRVDAAMSNSLGFGGQNSSLVVVRP